MTVHIPDDLISLLRPMDQIRLDPANVNEHDDTQIDEIVASFLEFGMDQPVLVRPDGQLIAGEGRYLAAKKIGMTDLPTVVTSLDSINATRRAIGDNVIARHSFLNEEKMAQLLTSLRNEDERMLKGTGYDVGAVESLLMQIANRDDPADGEPDGGGRTTSRDDFLYTRKIEAPTYRVTGEKPEIAALYDDTRTRALIQEIETAGGLSDAERKFLTIAAQRHTVLHFRKIAEFYAHADTNLQTLMENNALVIIDFNRAVELGYARMTQLIAEQVKDEYGE